MASAFDQLAEQQEQAKPRHKARPARQATSNPYVFPLATRNARMTSRPGRTLRTGKPHDGFDWAVPEGTRVLSVTNGTVEKVLSLRDRHGNYVSYGKHVIVRDSQGRRHTYAHLSGFAVRVGDRVKAGDVLGLSGNTGNSTGPHLHYEVRNPDGSQFDPSPLLGRSQRGEGRLTGHLLSDASTTAGAAADEHGDELKPVRIATNLGYDPFGMVAAVNAQLGLSPRELRETAETAARAIRLPDENEVLV